jgi:hypothetical protein
MCIFSTYVAAYWGFSSQHLLVCKSRVARINNRVFISIIILLFGVGISSARQGKVEEAIRDPGQEMRQDMPDCFRVHLILIYDPRVPSKDSRAPVSFADFRYDYRDGQGGPTNAITDTVYGECQDVSIQEGYVVPVGVLVRLFDRKPKTELSAFKIIKENHFTKVKVSGRDALLALIYDPILPQAGDSFADFRLDYRDDQGRPTREVTGIVYGRVWDGNIPTGNEPLKYLDALFISGKGGSLEGATYKFLK